MSNPPWPAAQNSANVTSLSTSSSERALSPVAMRSSLPEPNSSTTQDSNAPQLTPAGLPLSQASSDRPAWWIPGSSTRERGIFDNTRRSAHDRALENVAHSLHSLLSPASTKQLERISLWSAVGSAMFEAEHLLLNPWLSRCLVPSVYACLTRIVATWSADGPCEALENDAKLLSSIVFGASASSVGFPSNPLVADSMETESRTYLDAGDRFFIPTRFYHVWLLLGGGSHLPGVFAPRVVLQVVVLALSVWLCVQQHLEAIGLIFGCVALAALYELVVHHNRFMTGMYNLNHNPLYCDTPADRSTSAGPPITNSAPLAFQTKKTNHHQAQQHQGRWSTVKPSVFDTVAATDEDIDRRTSLALALRSTWRSSEQEAMMARVAASHNIVPLAASAAFGGIAMAQLTTALAPSFAANSFEENEELAENVSAIVLCGHNLPARVQICEALWRRGISVTVTDDSVIFMKKSDATRESQRLMLVHVESVLPMSDWNTLQSYGSNHLIYYITNDDAGVPQHVPRTNIVPFPIRNGEIDRLIGILGGLSFVDMDFLKPNRAFHIPQYVLGRRLGGGAFGNVFEVELDVTGGRCAVKRMYAKDSGNSSLSLHEIAREADIMSRLSHANIVQFLFCQQEEQCVCIFMELCENSLADFICNGMIRTATQFRKILREIIAAVCYLHSEKLLHRDLKPENVLFRNGVVKVTDFGTAAFQKEEDFTKVTGTFPFMAPEVLLMERYSYPCDVWSIGCLVADMLGVQVEHRILPQNPLMEYLRSMPMRSQAVVRCDVPCVRKFISDCLWRDPADRPEVETLMQYELFHQVSDSGIQALLDRHNSESELRLRSSFSMVSNTSNSRGEK
jgi:hypothetical protein